MNEDQLRIKKLELEIAELTKPNWQKPSYLTILVSVLTILISATIGFSQYFTKVNQENVRKVEELENKLAENKDQQHKLEIARFKYETLMAKNENEEIMKKTVILNQEITENQKKLSITESEIQKKQIEIQSAKVKLKNLEKTYTNFKHLVSVTIRKYKEYSPGYANGIINSQSGQAKINEIVQLKNTDNQRIEISRFAFGIMNQTYTKSTEQILSELGEL